MTKILVLFNLKDGVDAAEYEDWARGTDLPTARGLDSVTSFKVFRADGVMGSDAAPPYQYIEWLQVTSLEALGADAQTEVMAGVVAAFGRYADNPKFVLVSDIE